MNFESLNSLKKNKNREFTAINELLSYGKDEDLIHIHVVPDQKVENFMTSFRSGMERLAEMIDADKSIKEVTATSWIVAKHPKILERAGFVVDGEIEEVMRKAHFAGEKRTVWKAHISRKDLLKKYLNKNEKTNNSH